MMSEVLIGLIALWFVWEVVRAVRTGELRMKGSVIRRLDAPVPFYLGVGGLLLFAAAVLVLTFGFRL